MKKKIGIILLLILFTFTITGCEKDKKQNSVQNIIMGDGEAGTVTLQYPSSLSFSVEGEGNPSGGSGYYIYSHDYSLGIGMYFGLKPKSICEEELEKRKETKDYREYDWNGMKAYTYNDENNNLRFRIGLKENSIKLVYYIEGTVRVDNDIQTNPMTLFNEKGIQDLFKTMKYTEK